MSRYPPSAMSGARGVVRRLHLWLGLTIGLLFSVLGITGSALVFYTGIDAALHPEVRQERSVGPDWTSAVWDRALATGRDRWHDPAGRWTFEVTGYAGPIPARYYPGADLRGRRTMVWFSGDGARVVRAEPWGGYLMSWVYELHEQLLAGKLGRQLVGWSGVTTLLLLLSGVYAWWPRGSWRKALAFKAQAAPIRRVRDLHKLSGLGGLLVLTPLVATGVLLALPDVTRVLLAPQPVPAPTAPDSTDRHVTVAAALAAAHRVIPDGQMVFFDVPNAPDQPIRVRLRVPGDPHARFPSSFVFVDQGSGRVLTTHDVRRGHAGTTMVSWVRALHDGTVGGPVTRILAVIAGLLPAFLFVTGVDHWRRRVRPAGRVAAPRSAAFRRELSDAAA